ncbi:Cilia- and flagella-associated protein 52 [Diplonema papillatum]|nr:Cilia- and flagella-associated protein 52 [Diplonema papillatum]|eukprot:gene16951-26007_t
MATTLNLDVAKAPKLKLESVVGFGGTVAGGMHIHPDGQHLIYALGSCLVIREIGNPRANEFLLGHSDKVNCVAISRSGQYVASGQTTHMGFQADICVFEYASQKLIFRMTLHKVKVQALAFSHDEQYLASLGGQDDNTLVVWDLSTGRPLCGGPASSDLSMCIAFYNNDNTKLVTGGQGILRVWDVDVANRKIHPTDVNVGTMKRVYRTVVIEPTDSYAFVGTSTGDLVCIQLREPYSFKFNGPTRNLVQGIICCTLTDSGDVLVGSGGGEVSLLSSRDLKIVKSIRLQGAVTSVAAHGDHYFIGTSRSNVYYLNAKTFKEELRQTCHFERINDIAYPYGYSELFATCSNHDIRVWNAATSQELLRIQVANLECNAVAFTKDGKAIVSGWSDGKIRAFGPQSGKLLYVIHDAHKTHGMKRISGPLTGVTALCVDNNNQRLLSGGADSQVRVWRISPSSQTMEASMKEHKATVNSICIRGSDNECVSASDDGSCIVWDLNRFMRRGIIYAQTYFKATQYFPDESQILTTGSDKKVTYWDAFDCSAIRELEGSKVGEINTLDISPDGRYFVTGGADKVLKLWNYDEGVVLKVGLGHSGNIQKAKFSPDGEYVVSVGDEGGIFIWRVDRSDLGSQSP